ncbi:MAG: TadE/TadG family type IV pilus assembly protein [Chloroflexota bacterium]
MISWLTSLRKATPSSERGQAVTEFAIAAPMLLIVLFGIVELAHAFNANLAIINATREGARLAARGNIFTPDQIRLVIQSHSNNLDLAGSGAIVITRVRSTPSGFVSYEAEALLGSASSRFDSASLASLHRQATASNPDYLRQEDFVVVEVFYQHRTITGFLPFLPDGVVPMYTYTIMPIAAPS